VRADSRILKIAAISGALAVAFGAFGAHALREHLEAANYVSTWETATQYHLLHTAAILAAALAGRSYRLTALLWLAGIVLFSGSLYLIAGFGWRWLGPVTPVGGLLLIVAWLTLLKKEVR
jgi:uncharacterized membrane protein YgdD (TMEM256/DUF423 family)